MSRAIWTGAVSFGLVNVPVRMYSAIDERDIHFHLVHEPDGCRIGYLKVCKQNEEPVPDDEIVKAYEFEDGEYVYMHDEDFEAAAVDAYRTIEVHDFVPYEEIDPIYFERTYYLGPEAGSERVYVLLLRALEESGLVGIGKYVMREKQHLGALRVREGVITLERMYFADEVRQPEEITPGKVSVDARELEMARELIDRFTTDFEIERYEDTYREQLLAVIDQKRKGRKVRVERSREPEAPNDLMDALRASLDAARRGSRPDRRGSRRRQGERRASRDGDLAGLSKDELLDRAREADIAGRSRMSKRELVRALER
jgi:DNA end-binding protein Ku